MSKLLIFLSKKRFPKSNWEKNEIKNRGPLIVGPFSGKQCVILKKVENTLFRDIFLDLDFLKSKKMILLLEGKLEKWVNTHVDL